MNCLSWYDAYAFCIWDGGFLPTESEWAYATAGGAEQRPYAWGSAPPDASRAISAVVGPSRPTRVGSVPAGAGKWGHDDLAGNVFEFNLDWYESRYSTFAVPDSVNIGFDGSYRSLRGGAWSGVAAAPGSLPPNSPGLTPGLLGARDRGNEWGSPNFTVGQPARRNESIGGRCARVP